MAEKCSRPNKTRFRRGFAVITDFAGCSIEASFYKTHEMAQQRAADIAVNVVDDCRAFNEKEREELKALHKAGKYDEAVELWDFVCTEAPDNEDWMHVVPAKLYTQIKQPEKKP